MAPLEPELQEEDPATPQRRKMEKGVFRCPGQGKSWLDGEVSWAFSLKGMVLDHR